MERQEARSLLGLPPWSGPADVEGAFRAAVRAAHPDAGGDPAEFRSLVEARDVLAGQPVRRSAEVTGYARPGLLREVLGHLARLAERRWRTG